MKNHNLLLVTLFLTSSCLFFASNLLADISILKSSVEDRRRAVNTVKTNVLKTKVEADLRARDLKEQRARVQDNIRTLRQNFKSDSTSLKNSAKKASDDLDASLKKLKDTAKLSDEARDADNITAQAVADQASLRQLTETLDTVELPRDIVD